MIPLYVEMQACHAAEYRYFHDWQELTPKQQSILIAHYISVLLVKNNTQDAEARRQKLEALKAKAKKSK